MDLTQLASVFQQGSRSTVVKPLNWLLGMVGLLLLGALHEKAPTWVVVMLGVAFGFAFLTNIAAYVYFALKQPDALRSERFTLQKMQIERGLFGDNEGGFSSRTQVIAGDPAQRALPQANPNGQQAVEEAQS